MGAGRHPHPQHFRYLASSQGSTILSGQVSTEIPNKIAFVSRSSLATMVGFNKIAHCDRLLASVLEERDTLGPLMRSRLCLSSSLFDPPLTTDERLPPGTIAYYDSLFLQHPWEKNCARFRSCFDRSRGSDQLWVALARCGVASGLPPH